MVMAKGVNVGISTIYYWIHHGKLGLSKQDLLYPRKGKALKKQASTNFKPAGQSIEQRSEAINLRLENGLKGLTWEFQPFTIGFIVENWG
ncbi:IS1239%2C transposase%2C putative [Streptococcus pneumoniae]|nr:IS1239%2C transposase%2C putative [Streptococcus pneumoniae]